MDHAVENTIGEESLSYSQRFDIQTGLLNHQAFQDELAAMLRNRSSSSEVALLWIDLVNLRHEFSLWGWSGAEALARRVTATLRSAVEEGSLLGRVGGRSFVVAFEKTASGKQVQQRVEQIASALASVRSRTMETRPQIAAGVAFAPADTESPDDLIRFASLAASRAGQSNGQRVVTFNSGMNALILRDHALEMEMRKGIDQRQFHLVYQPKIDLGTGAVLGAEALIRWRHPELGNVTPGEFIPIAERSELIHRIFDFGLHAALEQMQCWRAKGIELPAIAVNASAANVRSDLFAGSVQTVLSQLPIGSTELELEMTESLAFEDEELFTVRMRQLKSIGVRIAIDDFGTRYTGFNILKHIPLDTMKIDQCFIRGIDRSPGMKALCQTIVAMARQLKLHTVAEGIEELGELEVMREIGCDAGQGYLFQRPVTAEAFEEFLRDWPQRKVAFGFAKGRMQFSAERAAHPVRRRRATSGEWLVYNPDEYAAGWPLPSGAKNDL